MGLYDTLHAICPYCGQNAEAQTKVRSNPSLVDFQVGNLLDEVIKIPYCFRPRPCVHCDEGSYAAVAAGIFLGLFKTKIFPDLEEDNEVEVAEIDQALQVLVRQLKG